MKAKYVLKRVDLSPENDEKDGLELPVGEGDIILDKFSQIKVLPAARDLQNQSPERRFPPREISIPLFITLHFTTNAFIGGIIVYKKTVFAFLRRRGNYYCFFFFLNTISLLKT